jgi:16S rRNA (guanine527-N7)-methyltransferase
VNDAQLLTSGLSGLALTLTTEDEHKLLAYKDLLLRWNKTYNLVSRKDQHRILERHILDSLSVLQYIEGESVADIGCGAGLPGIPLSIALGEKNFTLVDRSLRKIRFLRHVKLDLKLENVMFESWDLDGSPVDAVSAADPGRTVNFDTVVARAMSDPHSVWKMAQPLIGSGGRLVIQCGLNTEVVEEFAGATLVRDTTVTNSGTGQQHRALVLKKREG